MMTLDKNQTSDLNNQKTTSPSPRHPYLILAIAILFPGVGQVMNSQPARGLVMLFFMLTLGLITYKVSTPEISLIGRFAGGIFIYAVAIMDAYKWSRIRWNEHQFSK